MARQPSLKAGHAVTVWNRSPDSATALVIAGANCRDPQGAAQGADFVIAMGRAHDDTNGSRDLWLVAPRLAPSPAWNPQRDRIESST